MATVYCINKGINKPIEFKGLKSQYIWWMGGATIGCLILFAVLYLGGVNVYLGLVIVFGVGTGSVWKIYQISNKYGTHGLMKKMARRSIPKMLRCNSRKQFFKNVCDGKVVG